MNVNITVFLLDVARAELPRRGTAWGVTTVAKMFSVARDLVNRGAFSDLSVFLRSCGMPRVPLGRFSGVLCWRESTVRGEEASR